MRQSVISLVAGNDDSNHGVERFFGDITDKALRGASFTMFRLVTTIENYIETHNSDSKPFIQTATAADILEKVKRGRGKLNKMQSA